MKQRARNAEDKEERRRAILRVARELWGEGASFTAFNMAEVAERAGLAKGTVYLYFETKESLLLAILEQDLSAWFDAVDAKLEAGHDGAASGPKPRAGKAGAEGGAWSPRRVANLLSSTLEERDGLTRLLTLLESILEHNVSFEAALAFKTTLRERVLATGARIEARLPFLGPGGGAKLLLFLHALVIGLRQVALPPPMAQRVIDERPEMAIFRVDFGRELTAALVTHLHGLEHRAT